MAVHYNPATLIVLVVSPKIFNRILESLFPCVSMVYMKASTPAGDVFLSVMGIHRG